MFALVAAVILLLHGVGVLDNSDDANWLIIGLAVWAAHFAFTIAIPFPDRRP
jgi:hypothetical protein